MAKLIITEKDQVYGVGKITSDVEFNKLKTLTLEDYNVLRETEDTYTYHDILIKVKGLIIHPSSLIKLHLAKIPVKLAPTLHYDVPIFEEETKLFLFPKNAQELIRLYSHLIIKANTYFNTSLDPKFVPLWLRLFCYYGADFCACYDEYMSDPDESVGVLTEDLPKYTQDNSTPIDRRDSFSTHDIRATCHLILISMNKSFALTETERDRQITQYMKNRMSAVYSSMGVPIGTLIIPDSFFFKIGDIYRVLPKLRKTLFYFCYHHQKTYPEFSTACVLLSNSAMTTIKAMLDFIALPNKTMAHSEPIMLEEIYNFISVIKTKKDADGALWPYHRILHPTDGELNAAHFPNLAVSSIEYLKKYGSETFKYMVTPTVPTAPGIREKAIIHDTRDIYTAAERGLSDTATKGAKELGLDVTKLMGTKTAQHQALAGELSREDILRILLSMQQGTSS